MRLLQRRRRNWILLVFALCLLASYTVLQSENDPTSADDIPRWLAPGESGQHGNIPPSPAEQDAQEPQPNNTVRRHFVKSNIAKARKAPAQQRWNGTLAKWYRPMVQPLDFDLGKNVPAWKEVYPCPENACGGIHGNYWNDISCSRLINNDKRSLIEVKHQPRNWKGYNWTCSVQGRKFPRVPNSREEANYPIAYSIVMHRDVWQMQSLLHAIYQPQNAYCIHVDQKAAADVKALVQEIAQCFHNVFIASQLESVIYASYSRLKADLNCMQDLLHTNISWQYVINLTGQEFPLKTNLELVRILKTYAGANDIEMLSLHKTKQFSSRFARQYEYNRQNTRLVVIPRSNKPPPPHNITVVKGSAFGVFHREFVQYVFHNPTVEDFLTWLQDVYSPDEMFWATVSSHFHNPMFADAPGKWKRDPEAKPWLAKYVIWKADKIKCHGKTTHLICILTAHDLPNLASRPELFANKFDISQDSLVLDCLGEWIYNKTHSPFTLDMNYYQNLPFVYS